MKLLPAQAAPARMQAPAISRVTAGPATAILNSVPADPSPG